MTNPFFNEIAKFEKLRHSCQRYLDDFEKLQRSRLFEIWWVRKTTAFPSDIHMFLGTRFQQVRKNSTFLLVLDFHGSEKLWRSRSMIVWLFWREWSMLLFEIEEAWMFLLQTHGNFVKSPWVWGDVREFCSMYWELSYW